MSDSDMNEILRTLVAKAIYGDWRELPWDELPDSLQAIWLKFADRAIAAMDGAKEASDAYDTRQSGDNSWQP